ncbi:Plasmid stabilization system protein [Rubripirellula lacrimiformis]|uniref:Plasmid stabilization system protein n=1 Tax=Rubripirellula lacrimiformis TaxID=1930273 RepID=A0A517NJU5_9BACT|nr:type II toxin-antitoxin system RelE/ParE family toxin [Rubripirellula lacrimiformis]QDT07402.1 Plasmid stabilization system protein [Rubripirellula lacrimiformis]
MAKRNFQTEFHPEAIREIRESIQWYRDRNEQAADAFRSLVQAAESLIERSPESCAPYLHETLGYRFQKYPFVLAYILREDRIYFVALAHTRRKPGYWRDRLED